MTHICDAVDGLTIALHFVSHSASPDMGVRFLELINDEFGPLTELGVRARLLEAAFGITTIGGVI